MIPAGPDVALAARSVAFARSTEIGAVGPDISQALVATAAVTLLSLVVGAVLVAGFPRYTRSIRDETVEEPATAFAFGFVGYFGLLVGSMVPFLVGASLDSQALIGLGAVVALPGLVVWLIAAVVGGCFGLVIVGDWLGRRIGGAPSGRTDGSSWSRGHSPYRGRVDGPQKGRFDDRPSAQFDDRPSALFGDRSLARSLLVGALVLAPTQLVPILGTVVIIGVVLLGGGAVIRRWWNTRRHDGPPSDRSREGSRDSTGGLATAPGIDRGTSESSVGWGSTEDSSKSGWESREPEPIPEPVRIHGQPGADTDPIDADGSSTRDGNLENRDRGSGDGGREIRSRRRRSDEDR